ncbi:hypothetical protein OIU77_014205 [Salix suchowensis]|uniref:Uncharacterized protein n=1 Tax=Salix suchowensis TaxID=1278906 RepID=A0ABQ8ZY91_9ROSI|nr:hypothetical protein OIU77_014205 [Salix suchowensis]
MPGPVNRPVYDCMVINFKSPSPATPFGHTHSLVDVLIRFARGSFKIIYFQLSFGVAVITVEEHPRPYYQERSFFVQRTEALSSLFISDTQFEASIIAWSAESFSPLSYYKFDKE